VEIGPSATLLGMMKKTIQSQFKTHDYASSVQRQLLSSEKDVKDIYFEHEPVSPELIPAPKAGPLAAEPSSSPASDSTPKETTASQPAPAATPAAAPAAIAAVEDAPLKARDVVVAIISRALKIPVSDVSDAKSIKALSGGKCNAPLIS
jgi:fatty acid synthase subunit alpha